MKQTTFKYLKKMGTIIAILSGLIVTIGVLFVNLSPQFGGKISKNQKALYQTSKNYIDGKFMNTGDVKMNFSTSEIFQMIGGYLNPPKNTAPDNSIPVIKVDSMDIVNHKLSTTNLIWFGHSSFLLQLDEKNILIDPMFSETPAPHPLLGSKRFNEEMPIEIEKLPFIDAVIISHDHYDHLDYETIQKLKEKVGNFYTPLGVGVHLKKWGIEENRIHEFDWWEGIKIDSIQLTCTPAQHFSGRGLTDGGSTLWSSWVIQSKEQSIFFSGDSGYGDHFKAIGEKFGPFDLALMECGQYNELWSEIHMMPEETVQASLDINTKRMIPIHWGAFKLALHPWKDPIERVSNKALKYGLQVISPQIGERLLLNNLDGDKNNWWKPLD